MGDSTFSDFHISVTSDFVLHILNGFSFTCRQVKGLGRNNMNSVTPN